PDHCAPRHSPGNREGRRRWPGHAARHGACRARDDRHAAGHRRRRSAGARGPRVRALRGAARPPDDGDATQCSEPGRRVHVAGERARSRRDRRQGHAAGGRDQRGVLDPDRLHRDRHFPVPHPRTLRHGRRQRARPLPRRKAMSFDGLSAVLLIPIVSAALLAALLTFLSALSLFFGRPQPGSYLLVDDLNNVFIVLTTFVGFTTSVFSASYIDHELEIGRLTPTYLRFYHAMYQMLMFAMNLALLANNIGVMWVAIELATLTTVLMVGFYRTHEALEAAWKYFILGSVGIALALFGTILVYMAARPVIGE